MAHNSFWAVCICLLMAFVLSNGETTTDCHLSKQYANSITGLLVWNLRTDTSCIQILKDGVIIWDEKKTDGIKNKKYSCKKMNGQIKLLIFDVEPEDTGLYRCSMIQGTFSDIKLDINGFRLLKGPKKTVCIVNGTSQLEWIVEIPLALNPSAIHVYATQSNGQRYGLYSYYLDDKTVFGADCDTKEYSSISDRIIKATCFLTRENIRRFNSSYLEFDFSNYYVQTSPIHTTDGETTTDCHLSKQYANSITGLLVWNLRTDTSCIQILKDGVIIWDEKKTDGIKNKKYSCKKMNGQIKLLIFDVEPEDTGLYRCSMIQGTFSDIKLDINGFRLLKGPKKTVCIVNGTSQLEWIVEIPLALNPSAIHVYATQSNGQRYGLYSYYLDDKTVFGADCDTKEYSRISDRIIKATCFLTRENIRRFNSSYLEFDFSNYYVQTSPIHTTGECLGENVSRTVDIGNKTVGSNLSEGKNADNGAKTAGATLGPIVGIAFFVVAIFICPH